MYRRTVIASLVAVVAIVLVVFVRSGQGGNPVLLLLADGGRRVTIAPGTPIFLEVFVSGPEDTQGPTVGSSIRPWYRLIEIRANLGARDVPVPVQEVEPPRAREVSTRSDGAPDLREDHPKAARLDGSNRVFRAAVAAGPEAVGQFVSGALEVVAVLRTPWWQFWGWRGRTQSPPITVIVTADPSPAQNELKLASLSRFHFKTAQYDRALQAAQTWVAQAQASAAAQTQLGDVHLAMGQRQAAWTAYWRALDLARAGESEEPPTAILTRLDRLVRKGAR
jgi:hypothetical protein